MIVSRAFPRWTRGLKSAYREGAIRSDTDVFRRDAFTEAGTAHGAASFAIANRID